MELFTDICSPIDPYIRDGYYKRVHWDANGRKSVAYYNEADQMLISQYYGDEAAPITASRSFYDDAGRLVLSEDPNKLKTTYEYDFRGRLLSMDEPDAGVTQYVYRRDGSIRFSQNAKQALANQYSYTHYDAAGRPTESGEWQPSSAQNISISMLREDAWDLLEREEAYLPEGSTVDVVKTYYDGQAPEAAPGKGKGNFLMGKVSYSEKLDEGEEKVSRTWYSYDERGRVVWMVQTIAGLPGAKTVDYRYGPAGNVRVVAYQQDQSDAFYHYYEYDADTRLKAVYTSSTKPAYELDEYTVKNLAAFDLQASYTYYKHGPLKQVKLADGLQTTDYYYTVQGWLKAINNPNDTDNSDQDVFSMQLDYFAGDYEKANSGIIANALPEESDYSGNIQTQSWQQQTGQPNPDYYSYQYGYDQRYQLREALFGSISGGNFVKEDTYSVSQLSYDANGNIQTLLRQGTPQPNDFTGVNKYQYRKKNGVEINQLEKVGTYASYAYNAIGQMVKQQAEPDSEAPTQYIEYDVSGKAVGVYSFAKKNDQGIWQYEEANLLHRYYYDDKGYRVRKEDKTSGKTTYYVRDASGSLLSTYEQQTSTSDIELTEVPVYGASRLGVAHRNTDQTLSYLYELKDHLGNVRSRVMKSEPGVDLVSWHTYYPFGLENQALSSNESSYGLRHRYQGEFAEYDQETKLNHFELRQYDPVVGRWLSVDPMGQHWSPYLAMGNNPISRVDPDGGCDDCPDPIYDGAALVGTTVTASRIDNKVFDWGGRVFSQGFDTWNLSQQQFYHDLGYFSNLASGAANPFYFVDNPIQVGADFVNDVADGNYVMATITLVTLGKARSARKLANAGRAPKKIERIDIPKLDPTGKPLHGQLPHVHFKDGRALNIDGTWKHGSGGVNTIDNKSKNWLIENGWTLPKE